MLGVQPSQQKNQTRYTTARNSEKLNPKRVRFVNVRATCQHPLWSRQITNLYYRFQPTAVLERHILVTKCWRRKMMDRLSVLLSFAAVFAARLPPTFSHVPIKSMAYDRKKARACKLLQIWSAKAKGKLNQPSLNSDRVDWRSSLRLGI